MTKTQLYIDEMRKNLEKVLKRKINDKEIYTKLGIAPSRFNRLKTGQEQFASKHIVILANYVHISPAQILVEIEAEKAKTEEEKKTWNEAVKKMVSGFAGIAIISGTTLAPVEKAQANTVLKSSTDYILYEYYNVTYQQL